MSAKTDAIRKERIRFESGNAEAARIILSDPRRFEGVQTVWARLYVARHHAQMAHAQKPLALAHRARVAMPPAQGNLFDAGVQDERSERAA